MAKFPDMCTAEEAPDGEIVGIGIGKVEGDYENQHGHVSVLSISSDFRFLGYASKFMESMELISDIT